MRICIFGLRCGRSIPSRHRRHRRSRRCSSSGLRVGKEFGFWEEPGQLGVHRDFGLFADKPSGLLEVVGHRGRVINLGLNQGWIENCAVRGRVVGVNSVSGLVGHNFGEIAVGGAMGFIGRWWRWLANSIGNTSQRPIRILDQRAVESSYSFDLIVDLVWRRGTTAPR